MCSNRHKDKLIHNSFKSDYLSNKKTKYDKMFISCCWWCIVVCTMGSWCESCCCITTVSMYRSSRVCLFKNSCDRYNRAAAFLCCWCFPSALVSHRFGSTLPCCQIGNVRGDIWIISGTVWWMEKSTYTNTHTTASVLPSKGSIKFGDLWSKKYYGRSTMDARFRCSYRTRFSDFGWFLVCFNNDNNINKM